jgi:hypothetical protein
MMRLFQASDAVRLSGLTTHQLREWCGRRGVVIPDVPAAGRGRHALFSWRTILALRILHELHGDFGVEVIAWRRAIAACQKLLEGRSFPSLWGASVAFPSTTDAILIHDWEGPRETARLVVPLGPHLRALASDHSAPPEAQLPLFAVMAVRG